jgi:pimeloyl-ACP methyl ester carboxylesterase
MSMCGPMQKIIAFVLLCHILSSYRNMLGQVHAFSRLGLRPQNNVIRGSKGVVFFVDRPSRPRWMTGLKPEPPGKDIDIGESSIGTSNYKKNRNIAGVRPPFSSLRQQQQQQQQGAPLDNLHHASIVPFLFDLGTKALLGTAGVAVALLGLLYFNQESMLYIPQLDRNIPRTNSANPRGYRSPKEYKYNNLPFEEAWIPTKDGAEIHTWLLLKDESAPTIVFFHGNAGNIGIRLPNAEQMYQRLDCNVFLVEYRGYGDSRGESKPNEDGLKLDGDAAVNYIQNNAKIDSSKIILFGRSLGGAVAFHVAQVWQESSSSSSSSSSSHPPLAGMIVENTFCSIDDMADILFPFLKAIKGPLLKMHWNSKAIVANGLDLPILYLAGEDDEIVPPLQMRDLFQLSQESSRLAVFHAVPTGRHNDTWLRGGENYWKAMLQFIQMTTTASQKG